MIQLFDRDQPEKSPGHILFVSNLFYEARAIVYGKELHTNECKRLDHVAKMPDTLNKTDLTPPGAFQQQIKGFGWPLSAYATFPYSELNGPL